MFGARPGTTNDTQQMHLVSRSANFGVQRGPVQFSNGFSVETEIGRTKSSNKSADMAERRVTKRQRGSRRDNILRKIAV